MFRKVSFYFCPAGSKESLKNFDLNGVGFWSKDTFQLGGRNV